MARQGLVNLVLSTLAFVISSGGSVLLHIVFATTIYRTSGSSVLTAAFLSLQWLPVIVVTLYKSNWEDGRDPRTSWMRFDFLSAVLTLPLLAFLDGPNYLALFVLLFVRGVVDQITRILKTVASRYIFPGDKQTLYASILQTGYHLGIAFAAFCGVVMIEHFSILSVTLIDCASFAVAGMLLAFVKNLYPVEESSEKQMSVRARAKDYLQSIASDRRLLFCVALPPLTSTLFQGTYSVLQPIYPIEALNLGSQGMSYSYILMSLAILLGSTCFSWTSKVFQYFEGSFHKVTATVAALALLSVASYMVAVSTTNIALCSVAFTLMVFTFEFVFMFGYAGIIQYAPKGKLSSCFAITFTLGCTAGSLCAYLTGMLLDASGFNFPAVVGGFMGLFVALMGLSYIAYYRPAPSKTKGEHHDYMAEQRIS